MHGFMGLVLQNIPWDSWSIATIEVGNLPTTDSITAKKDLFLRQLYFSPELQLLTWFYGMILE